MGLGWRSGRGGGDLFGLLDVPTVVALLVGTLHVGPGPLGELVDQVVARAARAALVDGAVPGDEVAVRVAAAPVEDAVETALALVEVALPTGRAAHPDGDGLAVLAVGVAGAGEELPEAAALAAPRQAALVADLLGRLVLDGDDLPLHPLELAGVLAVGVGGAREEVPHLPELDDHHRPALVAGKVGGDLLALDVAHLGFCQRERLLERRVELAQDLPPAGVALGDEVQLLLHAGGEG